MRVRLRWQSGSWPCPVQPKYLRYLSAPVPGLHGYCCWCLLPGAKVDGNLGCPGAVE